MSTDAPDPGTVRQRAWRKRAAHVLSNIALDAPRAAALKRILAASGEKAPAWVRRMIDEHDPRK